MLLGLHIPKDNENYLYLSHVHNLDMLVSVFLDGDFSFFIWIHGCVSDANQTT